jgi:hypothetical protein
MNKDAYLTGGNIASVFKALKLQNKIEDAEYDQYYEKLIDRLE